VLHPTPQAISAAKSLRLAALPVVGFLALTLITGPFVAGNDAGRAYNTWPKMLDDWVPPEWFKAVSAPVSRWRAFFEDTAVVQFDHRVAAYGSLLSTLGLFAYSLTLPLSPAAVFAARLVPCVVFAQLCLGITTLMCYVPTDLGVAHQAGGVAVLTTLLFLLHTVQVPVLAAAAATTVSPVAAAAAVTTAAAAAAATATTA